MNELTAHNWLERTLGYCRMYIIAQSDVIIYIWNYIYFQFVMYW
jgi:hypothetical protein